MEHLDRQLDLEREMVGLGHRRYLDAVVERKQVPDPRHPGQTRTRLGNREAHTEAQTRYGRGLISAAVAEVGKALQQEYDNLYLAQNDKPYRMVTLLDCFLPDEPLLVQKDGEKDGAFAARSLRETNKYEEERTRQFQVMAFISLSVLVDSLSSQTKMAATAIRVGARANAELRFRWFKKVNPELFTKVFGDLERREGNMERRQAILSHAMKHDQSGKAVEWRGEWSKEDQLKFGVYCIKLVAASTDLITLQVMRCGKKQTEVIRPSDSVLDFIMQYDAMAGMRFPMFLPSVCPPKPWTGVIGGGYYSSFRDLAPIYLVKGTPNKRHTAYLKELQEMKGQMPLVYAAINAVQATPWRINKPVYEIMQQAWLNTSLSIGSMPQRTSAADLPNLFPLETYPEGLKEQDPDGFKAWKLRQSNTHKARVTHISRVLQMERLMFMAEKFAPEEAIYFPTQLDFRGRMYPMASFLNPQGTDCAKGLLTFARGAKLGKAGWRWLHIHIANMAGEDKISFDAREKWTLDNYHWIVDCVKAPFVHREWMDTDKPWEFIAGAIELVAAVESGDYENFISHLPVTVDGTCNGLQHFSAMLLDEEGAASVNLQPSDLPSDIYQIVADKTKAKFRAMDEPLAKAWLEWGFDRKATKRAVMILPYSGTVHAAREYVRDYVKDRKDSAPWDASTNNEATQFFSKHVWKTIGETITSAGDAMTWLKAVASAVTKAGEPIRWKTPLNFLVQQDNRETASHVLNLMVGLSTRVQTTYRKETDKLDAKAQRLGVSPNFIHSLDAACLMLTVTRAVDEGIEDFAMVHDSYGVLAGKMDLLYMGLRQAFVDVYQNDVMQDFVKYAAKDLPEEERQALMHERPTKGSFRLESVKDSLYFFA